MIIDEVDQAGNFASFVTFLGVLRDLYLHRKERPTFQSGILAGVYDVKNIKLKIRPDDDHQMNSPWNIAVSFTSEMSLSYSAISKMLSDYKSDHGVDFDESIVAQEIVDWTSGYPYLVSRICQLIDSNNFGWDHEGVNEAVKYILKDKDDTLCVSFVKKLEEFPKLKNLLRSLLFAENEAFFNPMERYIEIGLMFDFLKLSGNIIKVSNRLLETMLYNLFIEENKTTSIYQASEFAKNQFVKDGFLDMPKVLDKFSYYFNKIYNEDDVKFVEEQGKKMFLLYLRPIINGIGNYYIEAETRDKTRTDIIVDYKSRQYVIELKI